MIKNDLNFLVVPRNKLEGEECGDCSIDEEGSDVGIDLMPIINIGPSKGCGSCKSGLECVKENEEERIGTCQLTNSSQPPGIS